MLNAQHETNLAQANFYNIFPRAFPTIAALHRAMLGLPINSSDINILRIIPGRDVPIVGSWCNVVHLDVVATKQEYRCLPRSNRTALTGTATTVPAGCRSNKLGNPPALWYFSQGSGLKLKKK